MLGLGRDRAVEQRPVSDVLIAWVGQSVIALARDGLAAGRVTRRANALVLLDKGMSCQQVAEVLLFDDDTIRGWYELFEQSGVEGLSRFDVGGSSSKMTPLQCGALKAWVGATLPRSTRHIGAWIAKEFGLVYESRSGLIARVPRWLKNSCGITRGWSQKSRIMT